MYDRLTRLLDTLSRCTTFEEGADATLRAAIDEATDALAASEFAKKGRVLRGMVHLRPEDGYRRLVVSEASAPRTQGAHATDPNATPSCVPSATAWRWVSTYRAPVAIDVNLGLVFVDNGAEPTAELDADAASPFDSSASRVRMMSRDASHVWVAPLRMPGGGIDGMLSIEADCRGAIGKQFIWAACAERMQMFAAVAAPYLATLPARPPTVAASDEFLPIVGATMSSVVQTLRVFAQQEETVLLSGPTGAGKSRLARWCHAQSQRHGSRFETVDLATVPEDLQIAELFGWKKGAFTGAVKDTPGAIARAEGGTLFIDEIDKLSLRAQAGLLRVLEERQYRPLGEGVGDRVADVRFIVGTNANLFEAVRNRGFREDLYYRVNVLPVRVPPLDERRDEIGAWAEYMLTRRHRTSVPSGTAQLASDAVELLAGSHWPGNLRQLDNVVRRSYALALTECDAPPSVMTLRGRHVERALALESGSGVRPLLDLLHQAATAFVLEASRRQSAGETFDLDHAEAFRAFVLGAAIQKTGSIEEAFKLVGHGSTVQNRNHRKVLRGEFKRLEALAQSLGQKDAPVLAGLLGSGDLD